MKLALATGLLMATTSINADYTCGNGARASITVQVAGRSVQTILCKNLPGVFEAGQLPKNDKDPAQIYLAQLRKQVQCGQATGCSVFCRVRLLGDPLKALETLGGEQKSKCEAAGGTYQIKAV